jgi:predicted NUDIX family NTP pyrophosphohydrolase
MAKQSAGVLLYRKVPKGIELLLVHPGGPFWAKKDKGAWTVPKGEYTDAEEALDAAKREFQEETGQPLPEGEYLDLDTIKNKSGKVIHVWAAEGDMNPTQLNSNSFMVEWPPRSGKEQEFKEVDKAGWFTPEKALEKLHPAQAPFIARLVQALGLEIEEPPQQVSLGL